MSPNVVDGRLGCIEGWVNKKCFICWWSLDAEVGSLALRHVIWLSLSSISLSFQLGYIVIHTHTHTHARSLTHSLCLSDTDSLLSALERGLRLTLSAQLLNGGTQPRADRAVIPLEPSAACVRRRRQVRGAKLAPCHHNTGVLLTGEETQTEERREQEICSYVADTAVTWSASHPSNPGQFVT